jgi:hypothetical protein
MSIELLALSRLMRLHRHRRHRHRRRDHLMRQPNWILVLFILTLQHLAQQREQRSNFCVGVVEGTDFPTFFCTAVCAPIEKASTWINEAYIM